MTGLVFTAVLSAALVHATWNALLHTVAERWTGFALAGLGGMAASAVLLPFVQGPDPASWPFLAASVIIHVGYLTFLMLSFRLGDFGQVYPLARGFAPVAVALAAALLLGETPGPGEAAGVAAVSAGLVGLAFAGGFPGRAQGPAIAAALATGVMIATYTVVDGIGVRLSGAPLGYAAWLVFLHSALFLAVALAVCGRGLLQDVRRPLWRGVAAGALSLPAYGLVLWAQTMGPLGAVAALRETSIVFGAVIAAAFFREPLGRPRIAASIVIAAGVAVLTLG